MRLSLLGLLGFRLAVLLLLMVGVVGEGYGQRVYADEQESNPSIRVTNQGNAIDAADTASFSTLSVPFGLLLVTYQNLQFKNVVKPKSSSPVIIKIGTNGSLLDLLGSFNVQRTDGGGNSVVNPAYGQNQLLNLLNLFGGDKIATAIIPPNKQVFDGVRFQISSLLSVGQSANYYYAFYILPPEVSSVEFCIGTLSPIVVSNFQPGYTYKIYDQEIGGNEIPAMETSTGSIPLPSDLPVGTYTYWLEAREGDVYPSARTEFNVTIYPNPGIPQIEVK